MVIGVVLDVGQKAETMALIRCDNVVGCDDLYFQPRQSVNTKFGSHEIWC